MENKSLAEKFNTWSENNKERFLSLIGIIEDQIQIDGIGLLNRIVKIDNDIYKVKFSGYKEVKIIVKLFNSLQADKPIRIINEDWSAYLKEVGPYPSEYDLEKGLFRISPWGELTKSDLDNNLILELWRSKKPEETKETLTTYKSYAIKNNVMKQQPDGVAYWVTFSKNREVILNNEFLLSKPDFDSENDNFFEYIYYHAGEKLSRNEIQENLKIKLKKTNHQILEGLGFKGEIKKLFFPGVSKNSLTFCTSISKNDVILSTINIQKVEKELDKLRDRRSSQM